MLHSRRTKIANLNPVVDIPSMNQIKALTAIFGTGVVGVVVSLIMTIYTGVQESKEKARPVDPGKIAVPAIR